MQRRRRYYLKLSGLTGHVLDLFLLLTNSPDPTTGYASSWSGLLGGKLCAQTIWQWVSGLLFWKAMIFEAPLMKRLYGSGLGTGMYIFEASWAYFFRRTKKRCYDQVSNLVHMKQVETITFNFLILFSFACVHIQSACIIIIIMMTFRFNLLVLWLFDKKCVLKHT